jgi:ATP-binding cassette subfamily C protein LapB
MRELLRRLVAHPLLTGELLVATLFITVLNLASPIFVIQVLNRYVSHGITGTLITLTVGMLIAMLLQFFFRLIRTRIGNDISIEADQKLSTKVLDTLAGARALDLLDVGRTRLQESVGRLQHIRNGYSGANIANFLDGPFAVLYLLAALIISPLLAGIGLIAICIGIAIGIANVYFSGRSASATQEKSFEQRALIMSAVNNLETVRVFSGARFLSYPFYRTTEGLLRLTQKELSGRELYKSTTMMLTILLSVTLYAVGAIQVVDGMMSVGALIGINILVTRSFSTLTQFIQAISVIIRAQQENRELQTLFNLAQEDTSGTCLLHYSGRLEFVGLAFTYPRAFNPLFENVDLSLSAGDRLIITGQNGCGKTTLVRLLNGLFEPERGSVLIDQVDLRQVDLSWWRSQLIYLPQEPTFLPGTIKEAISITCPQIESDTVVELINRSGLKPFLDSSVDGLETQLLEDGRNLPQGIRRRLALARAMATDGQLVILDEPTEALDEAGCQCVYALLNDFAAAGKTLAIVTRDEKIIKGATHIVDLDQKPTPVIKVVRKYDG